MPEPVGPIVAEVNQVLRGWGAYLRVGNPTRQFAQVDNYARERLALFLRKKRGRSGRGWQGIGVAFFPQQLGLSQLTGTVTGAGQRRPRAGARPRKAGCGRTARPV